MMSDRRTLVGKVGRGIRWRWNALWHRAHDAMPHFAPVLRELCRSTGRGPVDAGRDLFSAWREFDCDPVTFASIMLWDTPRARWHDFWVGPELDRFMRKTSDTLDLSLTRDKAAFAETERRAGLPWLPNLALVNRQGGPATACDVIVKERSELWPILDELRCEQGLVLKPSRGRRGVGFFHVSMEGEVRDGDGRALTRDTLTKKVFEYSFRNTRLGYVVQAALTPSPDLVALTGVATLNTVRVVTALSKGSPYVVEAFLKIPGPGHLTDNFRDGTTGTFISGFDPATGILTDLIGRVRPKNRYVLERSPRLPATGRQIAGATLPRAREIIDLACRAAMAHPRTATLGWDIAIAETGLFLLDGNSDWGPGWQPGSTIGVRPLLARLFPDDFRPPLG